MPNSRASSRALLKMCECIRFFPLCPSSFAKYSCSLSKHILKKVWPAVEIDTLIWKAIWYVFFGLLLQAGLLMLPNFFATQIHSVRIKAFSFGLAKCYQINIRRMKNTKCEMRCDVMLNKSIHHANAKLAAKWRSDTPCSLHAYIFMIEWYFFITFSLLYTFFWLNPHNHSGVVTPQCRKGLYKPPCVSFIQLILSHSLTHSLLLRLFTSDSYRTVGCHKTFFFSVVLAVKWTKRIWENVCVLERSQKRYNRIFVRVDYVLCSTTFLLLLLFHRVRVCVSVCISIYVLTPMYPLHKTLFISHVWELWLSRKLF